MADGFDLNEGYVGDWWNDAGSLAVDPTIWLASRLVTFLISAQRLTQLTPHENPCRRG